MLRRIREGFWNSKKICKRRHGDASCWTPRDEDPGKLNPKAIDSWDRIIFAGNLRKANLESFTYCLRIEDTAKYLGLIPNSLAIGTCSWFQYLQKISHLIEKPDPEKNPITGALGTLFGMEARHYSVGDAAINEFYGYRRSSNAGRIVRFHIKINSAAEKGLTSFENTYFQDPDHWVVSGHGMEANHQTYLLGHARAGTDKNRRPCARTT